MLSVDQLRMSIVYYFIYYLIYKDEILSYWLFIQDTTVVPEHLHHPVNNLKHARWLNIVLGSRNKIYAKFLREEIVDSIDILKID